MRSLQQHGCVVVISKVQSSGLARLLTLLTLNTRWKLRPNTPLWSFQTLLCGGTTRYTQHSATTLTLPCLKAPSVVLLSQVEIDYVMKAVHFVVGRSLHTHSV